ncbi:MAG: hypothetical protein A2W98_01875 [Bacteroidetes bacterium GWF2_33_38]|nr:MAG: hypothetical protein A2W98_01875 [Bacteroidetes bacterium GWF2_33_38]OFY75828.1 MAG: hypothetical protein A2265_07945 [Bacteroidetes bacterium RIFOXYA12_FULL_33_9]OFY89458.1 MAG: hypothetical protein A2236_01225 [Bacteroidetes bacterium RIFOXYA2_FULL_33_7]HBX52872.1 hypothetical protein [Bacteroidales bacterium]
METKSIEIKFSKKESSFIVTCEKIYFKKIQILKGNIKAINCKFQCQKPCISFGNNIASHEEPFKPENYIDIYSPVINGIYLLTEGFPNGWFDFSGNTEGVPISALYKNDKEEIDNIFDYNFILFADVLVK